MSDKPIALADTKAFSLVPTSLAEAEKIAAIIAKSELVPKDYRDKPQNVFVAIQWGQEVGLKPMQSMQNIAVINGRPSIYGDAALALLMAHPDFEDIEERIEGTGDAKKAICMIKRKGRSPTTRSFSIADAKKAGLHNKQGPWTQYEDRMLQMRARGFTMRDSFPDALKGLNLAEEVQDIEPEKDITPAKPSIVMPQAKPAAAPEPEKAQPTIIEGEATTVPEGDQAPAVGTPASDNQLKVLRARITAAGLTEADLCKQFFLTKLEELPASAVQNASKWLKENAKVSA